MLKTMVATGERQRDAEMPEWRKAEARRNKGRLFIAYMFLSLASMAMVFPFVWMVSTSLGRPGGSFVWPPKLFALPLHLDNYVKALTFQPFQLYLLNSFKVVTLTVVGTLLTNSLAAYSFSRLNYRGRDILFLTLLATLMLPPQVTIVPEFILMKYLGWLNTHRPLWVPAWTGSAFGVFLLRQFYMTIPEELEDAAKVDGASYVRIWWTIFLPLSKPALATLAVFTFLGSWNELLRPLLYLTDRELYTVQIGLAFFRGYMDQVDITGLMAASVVSIVPTVVLLVVAQRYFVQGIALTGLKG